jgi:UDP-3-O-[3-hydroxymyristoyl] glucosamine N-acyltransferase
VEPSADVADGAAIGDGSSVWHLAQVREGAVLGKNCIVGRGAYVGTGVRMGDNCKLQNYALVYEPAVLEDGVFVGPAVVFTNDHYPRSIDPDGNLKRGDDWEAVGVTVRQGASIGARSVCVAPVTIGRWALVAGVPARRLRWVGRAGVPLEQGEDGAWTCPKTGEQYIEEGDRLMEAAHS